MYKEVFVPVYILNSVCALDTIITKEQHIWTVFGSQIPSFIWLRWVTVPQTTAMIQQMLDHLQVRIFTVYTFSELFLVTALGLQSTWTNV